MYVYICMYIYVCIYIFFIFRISLIYHKEMSFVDYIDELDKLHICIYIAVYYCGELYLLEHLFVAIPIEIVCCMCCAERLVILSLFSYLCVILPL